MQEMGLERIDVDGNSVTLNQFVYASIPEANKAEAFAFLRDIGEDDIIKNEVKVQFGKGQDNEAGAFIDDCARQAGLDPEQKDSDASNDASKQRLKIDLHQVVKLTLKHLAHSLAQKPR